jgi:hypothetical protein
MAISDWRNGSGWRTEMGETTFFWRANGSFRTQQPPSLHGNPAVLNCLSANDCTKPSEERCKIFQHFGVVVITALISPYREGRNYARQLIGDFVEVYVQCPLQVLIERDVKGLYAKALKGEIPNFTGISDPYEPPENPEVIVETDKETVDESVKKKFGKRFWRWVTCLKRCSANLCWRKGVESASANGWG